MLIYSMAWHISTSFLKGIQSPKEDASWTWKACAFSRKAKEICLQPLQVSPGKGRN
jgi:hypothetical protein